MKQKTEKNKGFIALISVVFISTILLLVAVTLSLSGFYGRYNILDSELKDRSFALAEACADTALLKLANDSSYNPIDEIININIDSCLIKSVAVSDSNKIILIKENYKNYYTNLRITVDSITLSVISWEEVPIL
ncbi:MAG: hypothetical protein WAX85_01335 [Minisyncoccia bacterium]